MRRPAIEILRELRGGAVVEELDGALQTLVQQVQSTLKGGTVTLEVEVKPIKQSAEAVMVRATVKSKTPVIEDAGSVMFPTPEGNLQRSHYRQPELPGLAPENVTPISRAAAGGDQ